MLPNFQIRELWLAAVPDDLLKGSNFVIQSSYFVVHRPAEALKDRLIKRCRRVGSSLLLYSIGSLDECFNHLLERPLFGPWLRVVGYGDKMRGLDHVVLGRVRDAAGK